MAPAGFGSNPQRSPRRTGRLHAGRAGEGVHRPRPGQHERRYRIGVIMSNIRHDDACTASCCRSIAGCRDHVDDEEMAPIGDVIAANVRAERARRRWTQAELGERVGWPRSSVSDVESGRRKLTADDLVALCAAFEVTLIKLADGASQAELRVLGLV